MGKGNKTISFTELMKLSQQTLTKLKDEGERSIVTDFLEEWKKVQGQLEAVEGLGKNIELPSDVSSKIGKIKADMTKFYQFVEEKYGLEAGARAWSWTTYVPIAKPALTALGPSVCFYMSMDKYMPVYVLTALMVVYILWAVNNQIVIDFINAWRGTHDAEVEKHIKKLRQFYDTLRDFAALQNQLRKARTFDVRSILEEDKSARVFWIRHFGASTHSVSTPQMIEALLHANDQGHIVGKQTIQVVHNTIASIIDKNGDGLASPIELLDFLKYFGPVGKCVARIKDSLIDDAGGGARMYPWFTWRSKDRRELEVVMKRYGVEGDFVVRCSSKGGFAISFVKEEGLGIDHRLIFYDADIKPDPRDGKEKPFSIVEGRGKKVRRYSSLSRIVKDLQEKKVIGQAFMDPETIVHFSISGKRFKVPAALFMHRGNVEVKKTRLGEIFDPSSLGGFPRGEFWNSHVGHSAKEPMFLDRDAEAFNVVLNWYRYGGKLYVPSKISKVLMMTEIKYFRLPVDIITKSNNGRATIEFKSRGIR